MLILCGKHSCWRLWMRSGRRLVGWNIISWFGSENQNLQTIVTLFAMKELIASLVRLANVKRNCIYDNEIIIGVIILLFSLLCSLLMIFEDLISKNWSQNQFYPKESIKTLFNFLGSCFSSSLSLTFRKLTLSDLMKASASSSSSSFTFSLHQ